MAFGYAGFPPGFVTIDHGEMSASYLRGLADRWANDTDQRDDICLSQYSGNGYRQVVLPLVREVPGYDYVETRGYAAFFLRSLPKDGKDDLLGEFIYYVGIGAGGGDSTLVVSDSPEARAPSNRDPDIDPGSEVVPLRPACLTYTRLVAASVVSEGDHELLLATPHPSPTRGPVSFRYGMARSGRAALVLHDVAGRVVRVLVDGDRAAGETSAIWDLRDARGVRVPQGAYFARLITGAGVRVSRVIVLP